MAQVPCDADGVCMRCKATPPPEESLFCGTCATPWHASCLSSPPETLASTLQWECPDCSGEVDPHGVVSESNENSGLVAAIHAIGADLTLTDAEKARKRQELVGGKIAADEEEKKDDHVLAALGEHLTCIFCIQLPERPVTVCPLSPPFLYIYLLLSYA